MCRVLNLAEKRSSPEWPITELADVIGFSRATSRRYEQTLVELGYLEQGNRRCCLAREAGRAEIAFIKRSV
jgi:DNA-binding IclR family transcriptional regulator